MNKKKPTIHNPNDANKDKSFQDWYNKNTLEGKNKIPFSDKLDYDYYSFYKNNGKGNMKNHFPDTYKRPNHETFSNESLYSTPENPGGQWDNDTFIPQGKFKYELGGSMYGTSKALPPNYDGTDKAQAYKQEDAIVGGVSAVNPVVGGIWQAGNMIGRPIRENGEQLNEDGQLVDRNKAGNNYTLATSVFNPIQGNLNAFQNPNATTGDKITSFMPGIGALINPKAKQRYLDSLEVENGTNQMKFGGKLSDHMLMYGGPSHAEGGIQRTSGIETEGGEGEYTLGNEKIVFSNVNDYSKRFAKIKSEFKNRPADDPMAKKAMEQKIKGLFDEQENDPIILKGRFDELLKAGLIGNRNNEPMVDTEGNPIGQDYPQPDQIAGVRRAFGGRLQTQPYMLKAKYGIPPYNAMSMYGNQEDQFLVPYDPNYRDRNFARNENEVIIDQNPQFNSWNTKIDDPTNIESAYKVPPLSYNKVNSEGTTLDNSAHKSTKSNPQAEGSTVPVSGALMNSIGPVAQLAGTLIGGVDKVNLQRYNPGTVNYDEAVREAERIAGSSMATNKANVVNNARSSGQLLSNVVSGNVAVNNALGNQIAGIRQNEESTNTGIRNEGNRINTDISNEEQDLRARNKAAYRQAIYSSLSNIGEIGAGYKRDNAQLAAQETQNKRVLNMLNSQGLRYKIDADGNITVITNNNA